MKNTFDIRPQTAIGRGDDSKSMPLRPRTGRAANTVNVIFGDHRHVIVDDMFNVRNIQTARRDICRDHDAEFHFAESACRAFALALVQAAMQGGGFMPVLDQAGCHFVSAVLGLHEHDDRAHT